MPNLSVLIPARNEEWLVRTVEDVLANAVLPIEVIVVLDGQPANNPALRHPNVTVVELGRSIGQRAATNLAASVARGDFVLKVDGHSAFSCGFDRALTTAASDGKTTATAILRVLDPYHWVCGACGEHWLRPSTKDVELPKECPACKSPNWHRIDWWKPRPNYISRGWGFDTTFNFRYWEEQWGRYQSDGHAETMTPWGGCWCMTRDRYWEIGGVEESFGCFGHMNTELGCKSWLSGGRVVTVGSVWCAHLFRTIRGRPYPAPSITQLHNSRTMWLRNLWPEQKHPLSWMIERFAPIPWWHDPANAGVLERVTEAGRKFAVKTTTKLRRQTSGIVYYTDNTLDATIATACQRNLDRCRGHMPLVCVSQKPMRFGDQNIVLSGQTRSYLAIWRAIVAGLEAIDSDVVFLAEHDVLYSPEHFEFRPSVMDAYWYNTSRWCVNATTGELRNYRGMKALSHLCGNRDLLLEHFRARVARSEREGDRWVYAATCEPGVQQPPVGIDDHPVMIWSTEIPNLDIKAHGKNWGQRTAIRWGPEEAASGWGVTRGRFSVFLSEVK